MFVSAELNTHTHCYRLSGVKLWSNLQWQGSLHYEPGRSSVAGIFNDNWSMRLLPWLHWQRMRSVRADLCAV